jgi:transposase
MATKARGPVPNRTEIEKQMNRMEPVLADVAGIDLGSSSHYVAVAPDVDAEPIRSFGCYTADLQALVDWLVHCGTKHVAMEATGVYWVALYSMLERRGIRVAVVNAQQAKSVPGRKTDVWDANWIRRLHTYGLLSSSFVPDDQIMAVRALVRHREDLVKEAASAIQRMQKAMIEMNIHLHDAVSDITGVTGMAILRAIARGETDPKVLAAHRVTKTRATEAELEAALTGYYRPEQVFLLGQALEDYDFRHGQMERLDREIEALLVPLQTKDGTPKGGRTTPRKSQLHFDARALLGGIYGVDLTTIDGVDALTAIRVLSEVGTDVSAFPTEDRFASWLGLCPNNRITGGRVRSTRTRRVRNKLADALRLAANSLWRGHSALSAFLRRMRGRIGPAKAITATARKLAVLIYRMIRFGQSYVDQGEEAYERQLAEHRLRWFKRQARQNGYSLVALDTGEVVS